ncbi:hypothetical protein EYF80_057794 [Liparis tanakae]|uniref:Uncharacterized protein n=1 Tax=Liparis tanakae TaxID=230148 RepID=A0A4Z2EUJ3_9TELE|nr:hypothetical protein EYF80_057794 [Liparis tanakae]
MTSPSTEARRRLLSERRDTTLRNKLPRRPSLCSGAMTTSFTSSSRHVYESESTESRSHVSVFVPRERRNTTLPPTGAYRSRLVASWGCSFIV